MTNVIPMIPILRSPQAAANLDLPIHLAFWRQNIAEVIPHLRDLSDLGDLPHPAHRKLVDDTLPPLIDGLVIALAMARTAQDHAVMAALLRAINHLKTAGGSDARSALTTRVLLASAADALVVALAVASPVLWAAAAPLFDDTVEGGAA